MNISQQNSRSKRIDFSFSFYRATTSPVELRFAKSVQPFQSNIFPSLITVTIVRSYMFYWHLYFSSNSV